MSTKVTTNNRAVLIARSERIAIIISFLISFLMLGGKVYAFYLTQSTAILSDALESIVHLLVTGFSAYSVYLAQKPADRSHLYGHDRIVVFSIGLEGTIVFGVGAIIVFEAVRVLLTGPELAALGYGLAITAALAAINLVLGLYLVRQGQRINSNVLEANGHHVLSDMWTSLAVLGGLALVALTGIQWFDPLVALLAGVHISRTGFKILKRAVFQGMDQTNQEVTDLFLKVLDQSKQENLIADYHQLRHREVNGTRWIEVHLLFHDQLSLQAAHTQATEVERRLRKARPTETVWVTSHLEPFQDHTEHNTAIHPRNHEPRDPIGGLEEVKEKIKVGIEQIQRGEVVSGEEVFSGIREKIEKHED